LGRRRLGRVHLLDELRRQRRQRRHHDRPGKPEWDQRQPAFIKGASAPAGIAVSRGYIYWSNQGANQSGTTIGRANLDGSAINKSFVTGADSPAGVAVSGP
jgi:hypothetical protein